MKKMIYRLLSYGIDMLLISLIALGIIMLPFFNGNYDNYKKQYDELNVIRTKYTEFAKKADEAFEDNKITTEEYNELNDLKDVIEQDKLDKELSGEEIGAIKEKASSIYVDTYNKLAYQLTKDNYIIKIITIVSTILYLGLLQYILKGKTIGKLLFKIKVVDKDDINKTVPLWKYVIRSILVGEVLLIGADLICLFTVNENNYLTASNVINTTQYIYEIIFLIVMMMREDGRSIHDLILGTRVALIENGKEVIEETKDEVEEVKEVKEESNKEENKEEKKKSKTTSKKSSNKKKSTKKEFVSAEKVDD